MIDAMGALAAFAGQKYLNLETFRKSGVGVRTPVWFAEKDGELLLYTLANSGKVKRIRNLRRLAGVSEPKGERGPAAEILSGAKEP